MKKYILITGASSGIGYEMAKQLSALGYNLILTARRIDRLNQLKIELESANPIDVQVVDADLSLQKEVMRLYEIIQQKQLQVNMLVNNAGFGEYGIMKEISLQKQLDMIQVNITALTTLTYLFLKDMELKKEGTILNVSSLLAYLPFPYYTVYSATKAYVLAFTETLSAEMEGTGISIKALCPGPVDTAFSSEAMLNTNAYKTNKPMNTKKVAKIAIRHLLSGKGSKKVGFNNWFISNLPRITPDFLMMKIKKNLASPVG